MPTFTRIRARIAVPGSKRPGERRPPRLVRGAASFIISGTALDSGGSPLPAATVKLFRTGDDSFVKQTVADGSGLFSFTLSDNAGTFYVVAYLAGSPDVMGTTVNTLVATQA